MTEDLIADTAANQVTKYSPPPASAAQKAADHTAKPSIVVSNRRLRRLPTGWCRCIRQPLLLNTLVNMRQ